MKSLHRIAVALGVVLLLAPANQASAQSATVDLGTQKQYIRGFGGMVHIPWVGDLSAAERTLAFGNADGQLGFTVLRIAVPDGSTSTSSYVATAKAAIAAGGIVYASPWNGSGSMNSSDFATYADHLSSFVSYMKGQGAELYAIGTQNEPDYGSQGGWKVWTAAQCHDFMLNYGDKVGTKLITCESFNYSKGLTDSILNDSAAVEKMGVLGTHLYGTSVNSFSYPLFDQKAAGKERWMTEHYTDSNTDANSWPNALNVATELHNSMVKAQFNAYTWWYIKRSYGPINNGAVTKRGWCMAHWSKFVRPGFYRVDATESPASGVSLSAYKGTSDVVIVAVNTGGAASVNISIKGASISSFDKFTTSSSKNLAKDGTVTVSNGSLTVSLDGSSVTTLHGGGSGVPTGGSTGTAGSTGVGGRSGGTGGRVGGSTGAGGSTGVVGSTGAGGSTGVGGSTGAGGFPATGGSTRVGGSNSVGGSTAAGGSPATGGSTVLAGSTASQSTGGTGGAGAGGAATGGQPSTGEGGVGGAGVGGSTENASSGGPRNEDSGCNCQMGGVARTGLTPLGLMLVGLLGLITWRRTRMVRVERSSSSNARQVGAVGFDPHAE